MKKTILKTTTAIFCLFVITSCTAMLSMALPMGVLMKKSTKYTYTVNDLAENGDFNKFYANLKADSAGNKVLADSMKLLPSQILKNGSTSGDLGRYTILRYKTVFKKDVKNLTISYTSFDAISYFLTPDKVWKKEMQNINIGSDDYVPGVGGYAYVRSILPLLIISGKGYESRFSEKTSKATQYSKEIKAEAANIKDAESKLSFLNLKKDGNDTFKGKTTVRTSIIDLMMLNEEYKKAANEYLLSDKSPGELENYDFTKQFSQGKNDSLGITCSILLKKSGANYNMIFSDFSSDPKNNEEQAFLVKNAMTKLRFDNKVIPVLDQIVKQCVERLSGK